MWGYAWGGGAQEQCGTVGDWSEGRGERQGIGWDMLGPTQQSTFASVRGQWMGLGAQAENNRGEHLRAGDWRTRQQALIGRRSVMAMKHRLRSVARATDLGAKREGRGRCDLQHGRGRNVEWARGPRPGALPRPVVSAPAVGVAPWQW